MTPVDDEELQIKNKIQSTMLYLKKTLASWSNSSSITSFKNLYPLIWPLLLSMLTRAFITPINTGFAGRVGTVDLGAVGISFGMVTVTATGLGSGLAVSFETMAARSYGARRFHNVGVLLQKAFIFASFQSVLVTALWIHLAVFLKAIGVSSLMAELSEKYLIMYIPAMMGIFVFRLLRAYLIVLRSVIPSFIVAFVGVFLLIPFNLIFVYWLNLGVVGIAMSTDVANALTVLLIFMYILLSGIYKETWAGLSMKCFLDWKTYLMMAGPGAFNFLFKSIIHEIALLSIGRLGDVAVAGQTALFTVNKVLLSIPMSIGMAMNINMSKQFGERKAKEAKTTAIVGSCFNFIVSSIVTSSLLASKDVIGYVFSDDVEVITLVAKTVPLAALSFLLESITSVFFIICLAVRLQNHSIMVYLISAYTLGLPLGITLALRLKDITYLWGGLVAGFLVQFVMFSILFWWKVDFVELSSEIQQKSPTKSSKEKGFTGYVPLKTSMDSDQNETKKAVEFEESKIGEDLIYKNEENKVESGENKTEENEELNKTQENKEHITVENEENKTEKNKKNELEMDDENKIAQNVENTVDSMVQKGVTCKHTECRDEHEENDEDEEVTFAILGKKLLILATSIAILVISIIIRLHY